MKLNRKKSLEKLIMRQEQIEFGHLDDNEGANEYFGEIESVIDVLRNNLSDLAVEEAAELVGLESDLVFE